MRAILPAVLVLALAACGGGNKAPPVAETAAPPPPPQKTVFDTQLKALDKAKAVQDVVNKQAKDKDQQLKDEGG